MMNKNFEAVITNDDNPFVTFSSKGEGVSRKHYDIWYYPKTNQKISFTIFDDEDEKRAAQKIIHYLIEKSEKEFAHLTIINKIHALRRIFDALGSTDISSLGSNRVWKRFKSNLKGQFASGTLVGFQSCISNLNGINLCERLMTLDEINEICKKNSSKGGQAIALPNAIYQQILNYCIFQLEKYYEVRYKLHEFIKEYHFLRKQLINSDQFKGVPLQLIQGRKEWKNLVKKFNQKVKRILPDFDLTFGMAKMPWLSEIMSICVLICSAFSGARVNEALTFIRGSFETKTTSEGETHIIKGYTTKGNGGVPLLTTWQTHLIVQDALELSYILTGYARDAHISEIEELFDNRELDPETREHHLKQLESPFVSPVEYHERYRYNFSDGIVKRYFNKLAKEQVKVVTDEDIEEFNTLNEGRLDQLTYNGLPKFSPHDLRRTFAVFLVRNGFGGLATIKYQYKHKNINMSGYYAKNAELAKMEDILLDVDLLSEIEEEGILYAVDINDEIYNKSEYLSGIEGERISESRIRVYLSREQIEQRVRRGELPVFALPFGGYCTNRDCERLCSIIEFEAEKKECIHKVNTDKGTARLAKERNRMIATFNSLNTLEDPDNVLILTGIKQKIVITEDTLNKHHIEYTPFDEPINGAF